MDKLKTRLTNKGSQGRLAPGVVLAILVGGIFLAEIIAMIVVYFVQDWAYLWEVLLDATIMTVIIFPIIYQLVYRPLVQYIDQHSQSERILDARLKLLEYARANSLEALLQFAIDETEDLTDSKIGFFHFLEADQVTLWLQAWSTNTLEHMCSAEGKDSHYSVDQAGVWADAVRLRQPVIHNDYATLPGRKGMPVGHAPVGRELVIPLLRDGKVVAILGVGNKASQYTQQDVQVASTLGDFAWDIIEHKRDENSLAQSEAKFRTMADWTYDWEMWLDQANNIVYTSPSSKRITGYSAQELSANPQLLSEIVYPEDKQMYLEHTKQVHDASADPIEIEFRIISRDGEERWIEHVCRPLFDQDGMHLGRRVSNRDITTRKQAEIKIIEQNLKEERLTQALQSVQLDIARDIHDTLGQNIGFLRMNLEHMVEKGGSESEKIYPQITNMTKAANEAYDLIRAMLAMLQLGYSNDLVELFSRYGSQIAERAGFQFEIVQRGKPNLLLPNQVRQVFLIFREALNNIEKYAGADQVGCEFAWDEHALTFAISDNGIGFDITTATAPGHYGLNFMRARVELIQGTLFLESTPGKGTTIRVTVPNEAEAFTQLKADKAR